MNTETPSPMISPDDGAVLTQRGGGGGGSAVMLPPAERAAAFMASPRNSLSRGMRPPPGTGMAGSVGGGGRWWQVRTNTEHAVPKSWLGFVKYHGESKFQAFRSLFTCYAKYSSCWKL